jgi:hypothetical protein
MVNKIFEYTNKERSLITTQINDNQNVVIPVFPNSSVYINERIFAIC